MHVQGRHRVGEAVTRWLVVLTLLCGLGLVSVGCGAVRAKGDLPGLAPPDGPIVLTGDAASPDREVESAEVEGKATWYGERYHGRKTANGETFDMNAYTAAHRTLPFNTVVRVVDLKTLKSVVVRINDRGPFGKRRRIIDLAFGAAEELEVVKKGVIPVRLEIIAWGDGARYHHGRKTVPRRKNKKKTTSAAREGREANGANPQQRRGRRAEAKIDGT